MVELVCRNEPEHFFCLYNVLVIFKGLVEGDVQSVYKELKKNRSCIAFRSRSRFCPVSKDNKPCALLRRSHDSIIREQLYALEALGFLQRKRDPRKLIFRIAVLGRKASKYLPSMLSPREIEVGQRETDLSKISSKRWIECCGTGLATYGPFVGYLWKLRLGKGIAQIKNEIGERATNTFDLWSKECGFGKNGEVRVPIGFFDRQVRIRNWVTRKFTIVPPPSQRRTAEILLKLKGAKLTNRSLSLREIGSGAQRERVLRNAEDSGLIVEVSESSVRLRNDFDLEEYSSSIRDPLLKRRLLSLLEPEVEECLKEELASKSVEYFIGNRGDKRQALREFIRQRSEQNQKSTSFCNVGGRRIKRDYELHEALKKYHGYRCQIDRFTFRKANGDYYCETAHIKPLSSSKDDTEDNIVVLCANCHAELDHGDEQTRKRLMKRVRKIKRRM